MWTTVAAKLGAAFPLLCLHVAGHPGRAILTVILRDSGEKEKSCAPRLLLVPFAFLLEFEPGPHLSGVNWG